MKTLVIAKKVVIELIRDKRTVLLMFVAPLLICCLYKRTEYRILMEFTF